MVEYWVCYPSCTSAIHLWEEKTAINRSMLAECNLNIRLSLAIDLHFIITWFWYVHVYKLFCYKTPSIFQNYQILCLWKILLVTLGSCKEHPVRKLGLWAGNPPTTPFWFTLIPDTHHMCPLPPPPIC